MDIFFQIIFDLIFCWPGAGLRWVFHRGKVPFKVLCNDVIKNSAIGAMSIAVLLGLIYSLRES